MGLASRCGIRTRRARLRPLLTATFTYLALVTLITHGHTYLSGPDTPHQEQGAPQPPSRHLLSESEVDEGGAPREWIGFRENCTPPAIEQFPGALMSPETRKSGGLILHIIITIYMFVGIAIVCDEYFVPSLEMICDVLQLTEDVAGATFMAAGSSAPELATSIIAVFVAKDDIGISGVIGSAVFNIMFVISVCALFAGHVIQLNWWPLIRDSTYYCISICALLITIYDEEVTWYESIFLLLLYVLYIVMMWHNSRLEAWANTLNVPFKNATREEKSSLFGTKPVPSVGETGLKEGETQDAEGQESTPLIQSYGSTGAEGAHHPLISPGSPLYSPLPQQDSTSDEDSDGQGTSVHYDGVTGYYDLSEDNAGSMIHYYNSTLCSDGTGVKVQETAEIEGATNKVMAPEMKDEDYSPFTIPVGVWERFTWGVSIPLVAVHHFTTPDCRRERFRRLYLLTFIMSMLWIAAYSYIMVWMITIIGFTLGIPDTVMGLTLIAVGVSAPDALSSLCVAKQGMGDMAVSNAIGSNVFDILLCLGLPWFIKTAITDPGVVVPVESRGLTYSTVSLFSTVIFLIAATHLNGWKLDKKYGIVLLFWYLFFMVFASLYELNVFGYLNPPECESKY